MQDETFEAARTALDACVRGGHRLAWARTI